MPRMTECQDDFRSTTMFFRCCESSLHGIRRVPEERRARATLTRQQAESGYCRVHDVVIDSAISQVQEVDGFNLTMRRLTYS